MAKEEREILKWLERFHAHVEAMNEELFSKIMDLQREISQDKKEGKFKEAAELISSLELYVKAQKKFEARAKEMEATRRQAKPGEPLWNKKQQAFMHALMDQELQYFLELR